MISAFSPSERAFSWGMAAADTAHDRQKLIRQSWEEARETQLLSNGRTFSGPESRSLSSQGASGGQLLALGLTRAWVIWASEC